jgi:glycosyltransferase involved in cell wall biosynthesis
VTPPPVPATLYLVPEGRTEACSFWRAWRPLTVLSDTGVPCSWGYNTHERIHRYVPGHGLVVYQRLGWEDPVQGAEHIRTLHRAGCVVVQESDDDMWLSRSEQKSHAEMGLEEKELSPEQNVVSTRLYDGLIVSTERLRTIVHAVVSPDMPVEVVGNYIDLGFWKTSLAGWDRHPKLKGHTTIGWFGGNRYGRDLELVAEAWRRLALRYPDLRFVVGGYLDPVIKEAVPSHMLEVLPWLPVYPRDGLPFYGVGLLNMDIVCCSVADTLFNAAKTPIKFLEATAAGSACVVSPTLYGPVVEHGVTGLVAATADDWERHLESLLARPLKRRRMAERAYAYVRDTWSLSDNSWRFLAAWASLYQAGRANVLADVRSQVLVPG